MGLITRKARIRNRVYNREDILALVDAACVARVELGRVNDSLYHGEKLDQKGVLEAHRELDEALEMFQGRVELEGTVKLRR